MEKSMLIKALQGCSKLTKCPKDCPYYQRPKAGDCMGKMMKEAIAQLQAKEFSFHWIPFAEREPEVLQRCFTCREDGTIDAETWYGLKWSWDDPCRPPVTHWMPLPQPPKGGAR